MTLDIKLPEGFELIGNYNNQYVIAKNEHPGVPEPYVVWAVDYDKRGVHSGTYFPSLQMAQLSFCERAFGTNLMQDHESTEEHLLYAVANDDIKAAVKAVRELERQSSFSESAERPMTETKLTSELAYHDEKLLEEMYRRIVCAAPKKERRHILNIIHKSIYTEKRCPYAGAAFKALEKADDLARFAKRFNFSLDGIF